MAIKNPNPLRKHRRRTIVQFTEPCRTQQQWKQECDLHFILDRYTRTGQLPSSGRQGHYLDLASVPDYITAQNLVIEADMLFNELPAIVRERFRNDPALMIKFVSDPKNAAEAIKLGLAVKRETPQVESSPSAKKSKADNQPLPAVGEGPKA